MTGANTDRINVPAADVAAGLLLQVSKALFEICKDAGEPDPGNELFQAWYSIRCIAQRLQDRRSIRLSEHEDLRLMAALKIAHDACCDQSAPVLPGLRCACWIGRIIKTVIALLETVPAAEAAQL